MEEHKGSQRHLEGTWTTSLPGHQTQLYGPFSSFYFLTRLDSHIGLTLQLPHLDSHLQPNAASKFFASPTSPRKDSLENRSIPSDSLMTGEILSWAQEDYFLGLFWQSYHATIPIIDEHEFREHYESLRVMSSPSGRASRKPSPLVDIILALCIQYGMAFVPRNDANRGCKTEVDSNDSSIAGRGFYRRCQTLLSYEAETPSILTLQCHIFSAIYLRDASFLNMAHTSLAVAIRIAHILGLHQEPAEHLPRAEKELRKRLWWTVYALESKACMALGRPWLAQVSQVNCTLPVDDQELALLSGPNFASSSQDITWLSYHVHYVKLVLAARAVQVAFESKCIQVLGANDGKSIYKNPEALETLAGFLSQSLQCIRTWAQNVPDAMKTERRGGGKPFSTDRSALEVDPVAPQWLQRQRLLLELLYHNVVMYLYRPFICFSTPVGSSIPLADGNSISCLNHAIANTSIILQMLTTTDILNGWHEAYQFQWNATLSMIGFMFAYPVCPPTPSARKTINSAIAVFEIFCNNFAVAASATHMTRDLAAKVDFFIDRFRTSLTSSEQPPVLPLVVSSNLDSIINDSNISPNIVPQLDMEDATTMIQNVVSGTMGMGVPIDSFSGFEWLLSEDDVLTADL